MSLWLPRRDADGRWHFYVVYVPWALIWIVLIVVALLMFSLISSLGE